MEIKYKSRKLEKTLTIASLTQKQYGEEMAYKINQRLQEIRASSSVEQMIQYKIGRCHLLKGNRQNQFALDLIHPYRLVFEKIGNDIQIVKILEVIDYH